ncbi:MAG: TIGR00266 family protein, partial [Acidobacteria bacterium]|nr:TIGR00266 family protein [Acidobacteriota bacterium]
MDVTLKHQPSFSLAVIRVGAGEQIKVEPGAMVSHSDGMASETKAEGGLFGGLKRMVAGESFFQNTWKAPAAGGEITVAATLPGDMIALQIGGGDFLLASGAYVASEMGVTMDASWGGSKGFFGGGGLILLKVSGSGKLVAATYGAIEERVLAPGQRYVVDTGHIVGFDATVQFSVTKSGGWKTTILGGEGLVCQLTGPGRVLMQTRSTEAFLGWLIPKLPKSS